MLKLLVALTFVALVSAENLSGYTYLKPVPQRKAIVTLSGNATGTVYFAETDKGVHITGTISGLKPGKHGFHVHAFGDISKGCGSTGGHFNPHNVSHAAPTAGERHVGDLGNIEASANGIATLDFYDSIISLNGEHNIIGRGVVVHEDEDDLGLGGHDDSKTTGHAGARVGCGVIGTMSPTNAGQLLTSLLPTTMIALTILQRFF